MSLQFIIETSPVDKADFVFRKIIESYDLPLSARGIPDGSYSAASPADAFDYQHMISLTVKNEKITSVDYNEIKQAKANNRIRFIVLKQSGNFPVIINVDILGSRCSGQSGHTHNITCYGHNKSGTGSDFYFTHGNDKVFGTPQ
jgi:hypothetical protein